MQRAAMAETKAVGGQLGPRILGRLTPELILRSPQYMNPVNQYEIDLRANRIAAIENLGATEVRATLLARTSTSAVLRPWRLACLPPQPTGLCVSHFDPAAESI